MSRDFRVLVMPMVLVVFALAVFVAVKEPATQSYLSVITSYIENAARFVFLIGFAWLIYNSFRLYLVYKGKKSGDCPQCNWWMAEKDGRYGIYRKCLRCGATKKGW